MEEAVKRNLHAIYSSSDQKEATNFFSELISSETECSSLLKILIEIFLQEENENLKKMSLIIIREMNYDFIMESVFILFQNSSSKYYSVIEILTEKLASQKSDELIPMIDNMLSTSTDLFTFTAILQLLNSIKSVSFKKQTEITNFESKQKEYYEHFIQIMKSIIENQKPSAIEYYFMFYFANFFFDLMNELNETEFYHDFSFYFLQQEEENENHEDEEIKFKLIDVIVKYYPLFYSKNQLIDIVELLIKHCQRTKYIPNEMILIWPYLIKNEENSVNYNLIVANFIFPQFKFHPNLMIDDQEKFLDEFDPYPDSKSELPNEIFKGLIFDEIPYEKNLYSTVYQFVEEYYAHFVDKDSSEICRIFNFFSIFARPDNEYTQNFFGNKVIPLINTITNMKDPDLFLIIGICQLIKNISHFIDDENNEFFGAMCPTFVNFLKWSVFNEFDANEQILKLIFYFVINSISSLSKAFSIDMFDFNDEEATIIFTKISQLYTEINNESLNVTFNFLIEKMIPDETDIESFVCMIWNLIIQHKDKDLLDNFFILITNFFDVCFDEKETIFNVFFQLVTDEESKDFLIEKCYINVLELFVLFTKELLDKPEKVQFFIESIGKCIFEMICSINSELMPDFLIKNSKKSADEFQRLINEYKYFCYHIINYINDPNLCLEMFLKPFILPIIEKIEEINESCNFNDFSFTVLVAPLIKFKGNEDIFCFMFEFYETFIQLKTFGDKTKNYFLASLIISNPSILFDCFDKNQYQKIISETIPQLPDDILLFEIKEVLSYLAKEKQEIDLINAFAQLFSDELNKLGYDKDKTDDQIHFDTSTLYTFSMYNENLNKVISTIFDILTKFEAKFSNGE